MLWIAMFWAFLLSAYLLVMLFGAASERWFVNLLVLCGLLTFALNNALGFAEARNYVFAIDAMILAVALGVMAPSHSYWPIWFAGFQAITVATGLARLLLPASVPAIYGNAASFWSLPALLALVLGTLADHRMRTAAR